MIFFWEIFLDDFNATTSDESGDENYVPDDDDAGVELVDRNLESVEDENNTGI